MKRHPLTGIDEDGEEVLYTPTRVIESFRNGLSGGAWKIWLMIAFDCANNKSYSTNLTNKELAEKSKLSKSSIKRGLNDLEKYHFIERNHSGHIREIKLSLLDY
ncbi:hypothetical protein ES705_30978 [subsurface metagenome]